MTLVKLISRFEQVVKKVVNTAVNFKRPKLKLMEIKMLGFSKPGRVATTSPDLLPRPPTPFNAQTETFETILRWVRNSCKSIEDIGNNPEFGLDQKAIARKMFDVLKNDSVNCPFAALRRLYLAEGKPLNDRQLAILAMAHAEHNLDLDGNGRPIEWDSFLTVTKNVLSEAKKKNTRTLGALGSSLDRIDELAVNTDSCYTFVTTNPACTTRPADRDEVVHQIRNAFYTSAQIDVATRMFDFITSILAREVNLDSMNDKDRKDIVLANLDSAFTTAAEIRNFLQVKHKGLVETETRTSGYSAPTSRTPRGDNAARGPIF